MRPDTSPGPWVGMRITSNEFLCMAPPCRLRERTIKFRAARPLRTRETRLSPDGQMSVARCDIYGGAIIPFVPFTGSHQS